MTIPSSPANVAADASSSPARVSRAAHEHAGGMAAPSVVYLLADHLDAVLARGEDLLACAWRPDRTARCPATIASHQRMQRETIQAIRTQELLLISRALKARERARELAAKDGRFAPLARVFAAATVSLEDAAREAGDTSAEQFDTGNGILAYMRSRGMVARESAAIDDCGSIVVTQKFQVARRIELEAILDLAATFLDSLELHFDIYPDDSADRTSAPDDAGEQPVAPTDAAPPALDDACSMRPDGASSSFIERLSSAQQT